LPRGVLALVETIQRGRAVTPQGESSFIRFPKRKFKGKFQICLFRLLQVCSLKLAYIDQAGPFLAMTFSRLPCRVLSTIEMSGLDREVTPPRGVLSTTEMSGLDREVTPPRGVLSTTEMSGLD